MGGKLCNMNILRNVIQSRHFKFGLPFIGLLVGASFGLTNVTSHRYEFRKTKGLQKEDIELLREKGILKKPEESLEKLHEEYMQKQYSENYENLRIPRPWEDEGTVDENRKQNKVLKNIKQLRQEKSSEK